MPSYVVTGASRGLGYVWITTLATDPSNTVIGIVRNKAATEERLAKDGIKNVHVLTADVTDLAALEKAAHDTTSITGGALDVLIHNAAYVGNENSNGTVLEPSAEELGRDLTTFLHANVVGTSYVLNAFLPAIRKGKDKKVMVISTGMADLDFINDFSIPMGVPYSVSKAASNALVAKYNAALGKSEGVLFFSISPGLVDTSEGRPKTEEEIAGAKVMAAGFKDYAPHFTGPITPQESVDHVFKVLSSATVEKYGGRFVSHFGNKQWL